MPLLLLFCEALFHVLQTDLSSLNAVEDDLEHLILLPPPPECWEDGRVGDTSPASECFFQNKEKEEEKPHKM